MKRSLSILMLLMPLWAGSQVYFGLKTGPGFATLAAPSKPSIYADLSPEYKLTPHGGVSITNYFNDKTGIRLELLYSNRGTDYEYTTAGKTNLRYFSLPLLFDFQPVNKLHLEAGVEPAYLVTAETVADQVIIHDQYNFWTERWDIGIDLGLRFYIVDGFNLGVRYNHGLLSLKKVTYDGQPAGSDEVLEYKNRLLTFSLAYEVPL